jgi:hypothetical protein
MSSNTRVCRPTNSSVSRAIWRVFHSSREVIGGRMIDRNSPAFIRAW